MNNVGQYLVFAFIVSSLCNAAKAADGDVIALSNCIDTAMAELVSAQSREFTSPQYRVVCYRGEVIEQSPGCKRDDKDETFTFEAPNGYRLDDAKFKLVSKTFRSDVGDFVASENSASISLHCRAGCDDSAHVGVAGNIVGSLTYKPSAADAKSAALDCLKQILD